MTRFEIFDAVARLREAGVPFCVATVVRTADATSAKAGAKATVTASGEIEGHLGGACVQRAVRDAARAALAEGETRMISVGPEGDTEPDDVARYSSGCPSGGTVDILLEAYTFPPSILIFGGGPIAVAIAAHAGLMGFSVMRADESGPPLDGLGPSDAVIVASQGAGDRDALRMAAMSDAGHVAMVASGRKAAVLCARLREEGIDPQVLERIKSPAGLDLGAVDPHEIAISILAEIVAWRRT